MIIEMLGYPTEEELKIFSEDDEQDIFKDLQKKRGQDFDQLVIG